MHRPRRLQIFSLLLAVSCAFLAIRASTINGTSFANAPDISWAAPRQTAINNLGPVTMLNDQSYDCTPLTYRLIDDIRKTMRSGCFVATAFGAFEPAQSVALFNGSDEAMPVTDNGRQPTLSIQPHSAIVGKFGSLPGNAQSLYFYTDFYGALKTEGTVFTGRHKTITEAPSTFLSAPDGTPLAINPLALAYAARSQWLVTEATGQSLVRINLATFSVLPFDASFAALGKPGASHSATMAISEDGRYAAVYSQEFSTFRVYDLKTCRVISADNALAPQNCQYHDYRPYLDQQVGSPIHQVVHMNFIGDDRLSFDVVTAGQVESYLLSPDGPITSLIPYLGLGDSFASGQGAFNYVSGTDTTNNRCHLSVHSYPMLLSGDVFGSQGHSVACSGAQIHDVSSQSSAYTGQTKEQLSSAAREGDGSEAPIVHDFTPGNLAQQRFVTSYQPGAMTVQVGGNDIGFGDILLRCLSPLATLRPPTFNPNNCYQSYEDRLELVQTINRQYSRWVQLYHQLKAQSPLSRLYVIGYPQTLSARADCRANVHLTLTEITLARQVTDYLNATIQKAAAAAGVKFVNIADSLEGHNLCSGGAGDLAVNGLTAGTDAYGIIGQESFHPNAYGQELMEQAILQATHTFALTPKSPAVISQPDSVPDSSEPLLHAPRSNRTTATVIPANGGIRSQGRTIQLAIARTIGLPANSNYSVTLGDEPLGMVHSDAQGAITDSLTAPSGGGLQPVVISGPGPTGDLTTVTGVIYVPVTATDSDGDGLPDNQDPCPYANDNACDTVPTSGDTAGPNPSTPAQTALPIPSLPITMIDNTVQSTVQPQSSPYRLGLSGAITLGSLSSTLQVRTTSQPKLTVRNARQGAVLGVRTANPTLIVAKSLPKLAGWPTLPRFNWLLWLSLLVAALIAHHIAQKGRQHRSVVDGQR